MDLKSKVYAHSLLCIMLLLALHDVIPHTHHPVSEYSEQKGTSHLDHDHGHHHGDAGHDHDQPKDKDEHSLLDFLLGLHRQILHVPQVAATPSQTTRQHHPLLDAVLPEIAQIYLHKRCFLHHYSLFEKPLLHLFSFLADFSRRGPPAFH
ncbi:MAG: hypothetical protein KDC80_10460 [Saprospiraceae bacterium]|nr:hypothetical protein [Saprospiraceae bacterium]